MLYNFKTSDGAQWVINTETLTWALASSIVAAPSIQAAQSNMAHFVSAEEGKLVPLGGGRYHLSPRKPNLPNGTPQLAIVVIIHIPIRDDADGLMTEVILVQTNVVVKDGQHEEIKKFKMECLPPFQQPQRGGMQPPPAVPEMKFEDEEPKKELTHNEKEALANMVIDAADKAVPIAESPLAPES